MKQMNNTKRTALSAGIFAVAAAFFLFPMFYRFAPLGLNVPVFVGILYAAVFFCLRDRIDLMRRKNFFLLIPIAAVSAEFAIFNNGLLKFFNLVTLAVLVCMQILMMTGAETGTFCGKKIFINAAGSIFVRPFHKIAAFYREIVSEGDKSSRKTFLGVVLGIVIALPVLAVMLWLLTSGDMVFGKMVEKVFTVESVLKLFVYALLAGGFFTFGGSYLVSLREWKQDSAEPVKKDRRLNYVAVMIVTVALSLLMLIFSAVQMVYLTGLKELPAGFSYSEYARQGFFQLCAAAALVFAVIAVCSKFTRYTEGTVRIILNAIYTVLAVSVLVLLVSAFARMVMYEQVYRFTRLRLYTQAFMILLAVVTVFVIIKIWNLNFPVMKCIFAAAVIALIGLGYFNADGFIARDAVEYARETGGTVDYEYLSTLSVDALVEYGGELTLRDIDRSQPSVSPDEVSVERMEEAQEQWDEFYKSANTRSNLRDKVRRLNKDDYRTWNLMRRKAEKELNGTALRFLQNEIKSEPGFFE